MIQFIDADLDKHEVRIVKRTLQHARAILTESETPVQCIELGFDLPLFKYYGKEAFIDLLDTLEAAHEDQENVYYVTDYHFLILHQLMKWAVGEHNAAVLQGANPILMDSNYTIKFDELVERLFHDTDFLLTSEEYNEFVTEEKEALGLSPELFSICNSMPPHPSEVEMVMKPYKKRRRGCSL